MRRNLFAKLVGLALLMFASNSCTKKAEGIAGATGPAGQAGTNGAGVKPSPITGYIDLFDPYGNPLPDSPGVKLSTLKGDTLVTTTTDSTGKFSLPALPPGNYNIHVTKAGFDSLDIYVQHSGGDEAKFIGGTKMVQTLTVKITSQSSSLQQDLSGNYSFYLTTTLALPSNAPATERDFYFYFSHTASQTSNNSDYGSGQGQTLSGNQYTLQFPLINLTQNAANKFHSGDSVYVKTIEVHPFQIASYYYDYTADRNISYPYPGDSAVTSFRMP